MLAPTKAFTPRDEAYIAMHVLAGGVLAVCEVCGYALPLTVNGAGVHWAFVHESRDFDGKRTGYPNCIRKDGWGGDNSPMRIKAKAVNNGSYWIKPTRGMLARAKVRRRKQWP